MESLAQLGITTAASARKPKISVIIPTYNRAALLLEALASVFAQTWRDYEVIVVDDGSTDDTLSLLAPWLSHIRLFSEPNRGVAAARNLGICEARGEFICFLDSDDLWTPSKLETQLSFAEQNTQYALIASEIEGFDSSGKVQARSKASMYRIRNGFVLEDLLFANWIQTSTVMVRRETLLRVGGFDEDIGQFGEDWLLWMRIAAESPIYFLPAPLVRYRVHSQNLTSHLPETQYVSLMQILDRLALLPQFQRRPELIRRARYRIALVRGQANLRASAFEMAANKFQSARRWARFPCRALTYSLWTFAARWIDERSPKRIAA
jgi:glycosyltransferase involved in cell wall biosynthesis